MKRAFIIYMLLTIFIVPVFGQEIIDTTKKTALGVNPAIMEIILDEKPIKRKITLYNLTNFPLPIKTMVESFSPKERLEIPKEKLDRYDASSWIEIDEKNKDFILQPRENREISMLINKKKGSSPGGHYASIIFQPLIPQQVISNESIFIFTRVAVLTFMQIKGQIIESLEFKKININSFYQSTPETLNLTLKNTGNTHLRPTGKLIFFDEISKKNVGSINFLPSIILPETEKNYQIDLTNNIKLYLGKYSVRAELSYGADNLFFKSSKFEFYIFPYTTVIIIAVIFLIIAIIFLISGRRLTKAYKILVYGERFEREEKRKHFEALEKIKIKRLIPRKNDFRALKGDKK